MSGKRIVIVLVVLFSLMATLPVAADAAGVGTVYEGVSVPGIALGDSRAQVEAVNGPPNSCVDFEVYGAKDHCGYSVEGGGSIGVRYRAPDGGTPSGSPEDLVVMIRWTEEVAGWVTTAGVNTTLARNDRQAVIDAYPNAELTFYDGLTKLTDYQLGIQVVWSNVYIFSDVSMNIFEPYTPPPPLPLIYVADIEMSYNRRSVSARVLVLNEDGHPVKGASIATEFTGLKQGPAYLGGITDSEGYATFTVTKAHRGTYRITITNVTKEGFAFDYDGSVLVGSITKPK